MSWCFRRSQIWNMKNHSPLISRITALLLKRIERARVYAVRWTMRRNKSSTQTSINDANAERVHENGLHHLAVQQDEGNRFVVYSIRTETQINGRRCRSPCSRRW